ncbi:MAG TPA: MCE family protein [Nocardioides bacterium]|uniref:MCE family protein n=1 Tax=uncultured Nocardioides sp. TaxID=198441 RepID=UPI000EC7E35C|nr:MlaD family protein [uncultured Nocardioides sp.]HCB07101.1 MCE family protein [Nocardioides sp.]HRK48690.1 MlaD family protein [Nocardioides sp.]
MITRRTKAQLVVFVVITLLGVTFVGARYAHLDRAFYDDDYTVTVQLSDSGGIFAGGEVTYRGVGVGRVSKLELTDEGVDVALDVENSYDEIPADTLAVVGNRSAVGEQYVELQPQRAEGPYLHEGSVIEARHTKLPIATDALLTHLSETVGSVDPDSLATTVDELGAAFAGSGEDLQQIIDSGNSFIGTANDNFDLTTDLIRDSNTVLHGQIASESAIRNFSAQLQAFSSVLAGADPDLRDLIDTGGVAATQLRTFLEDNRVELGDLINNLVTTGDIVVKHLDGIKQVLVLYPYVVEGGFTVVSKTRETGLYDAHFGLVLTTQPVCHQGYQGTDTRPPQDGSNRPMNLDARCTEDASHTSARGAQHAAERAPAAYTDQPVVAAYDPATGELTWGDPAARGDGGHRSTGTTTPSTREEESWRWLFLQPLTSPQS